jgi:hypothetical protein
MSLATLRKWCLLFLSINTAALTVHAQFQYGLKGGLNISEILTNSSSVTYVDGVPQQSRNFPAAGYHAGGLATVPLSKKISLQGELLFSAQGATDKPPSVYAVTAKEEYKLDWINVPILLKYNLPSGFFFETGPQFGFLIAAKIKQAVIGSPGDQTYFVRSQFKSTDISWSLGTGYLTTYNLGIDVRYNLGLTNFSNVPASGVPTVPLQTGPMKNSVVQLGIFYMFGKSRPPVKSKDE